MLKYLLFLLVFVLNLEFSISANEIDSLLNALKVTKENHQAKIYNELAYQYATNYSFDTANIYVGKALMLATKYKNIEEQANAYYNYGVINDYNSNSNHAIFYKKKAAEYFEKLGDSKSQAICLNDAGIKYTDIGKPKEALQLLYKSYEINLKNNLIKGQVENLLNMGIVYYNALDYQNALYLYQKAIPLAEKVAKPRLFFTIYNNISSVYSGWGKHDSAIIYCKKALKIAEQMNKNDYTATAYNNIGYEYMVWKKYDQALEFFQLALKLDKEINYEMSIASDLSNIGLIHFYKGELDEAMNNFKESHDLAIKMKTPYYIALTLGNMGKVLQKQKQYNKAIENINQEIQIIEKHNIEELSIRAYQQLGSVYLDIKNFDKSTQAYLKSSHISKKTNQRDALMDSYKLISDVYKAKGLPDSALIYYELYTSVKDSIFTKEQNRQLAEFQVQYDLIKKDKVINDLSVEKQQIKIQREKLVGISIIVISILLTIVIILSKRYRRNKHFIEFLTLQKKELETRLEVLEKNNEKQENSIAWNLSDEALTDVYEQIVTFLKESKIYLSDELTINLLSQKCKLQAHHISKAVNSITSSNFNDFINLFRINEAKERLKNPKFQLFTIEAIGRSVGFKSRTSFIAAFKKFDNITPSEYKKAFELQNTVQILN